MPHTWVVSVFKYDVRILKWKKADLQEVDRRTRKRLTSYEGMHPMRDADILYVERSKESGEIKCSMKVTA